MEHMQYDVERSIPFGLRIKRWARIAWLFIEYVFDRLVDAMGDNVRIIRREASLFLGVALSLIGLLDFQNGKNCDGNTADYLACTRPSTFYYYSWWQILIIVIGVFLIMVWLLKRNSENR